MQPIKDRMKAPYFFVSTIVEIDKRRKIKKEVIMAQHKKQANEQVKKCHLVKLGWDYVLTSK